jgi:hypothetical protein
MKTQMIVLDLPVYSSQLGAAQVRILEMLEWTIKRFHSLSFKILMVVMMKPYVSSARTIKVAPLNTMIGKSSKSQIMKL